jgi:hypothetical protein
VLLNRHYQCGKNGLISTDDFTALQKECLKSCEALCLFGYREFYANILTILIETTNIIFENNEEPVDISIMEMFKLTHPAILLHVKNRMSFEEQRYPQTYRVPVIVGSKERSVVNCHCSVTRPVQFTLGTLPSTSNFTDKIGKNWTEKNIKQYFPPSSADTDSDEDPESQDEADVGKKGDKGKTPRKKRAKSKTKSTPAQKKRLIKVD